MKSWRENKEKAITWPDPVSAADQSQARETDINVIVAKMGITGTVPGAPLDPIYGDWTNLPTDLRGFIETSRTLESLKQNLPEKLKAMKTEELLAMNAQQLADLLKPATPPAEPEVK